MLETALQLLNLLPETCQSPGLTLLGKGCATLAPDPSEGVLNLTLHADNPHKDFAALPTRFSHNQH